MKIFKPSFLINLEKCILWQYDKATKLSNLIIEKEKWYKQNVTEFIVNFFINIFNLKTANDFGLNVWGKLLSFPRQIMLNKYQIKATDSHETEGIEVNRTTFETQIASGTFFNAITIGQGDKYTFEFKLSVGTGWYITVYDKTDTKIVDNVYLSNNGSPDNFGISGYVATTTGNKVVVVADYTPLNLSTEQYRFLLLGQVLKFKMSCTIPEVNRYLRLIFNEKDNKNVYVIDNHNMTISYNIEPSSLSDEIRLLIENYDFLPAPVGVKVNTGLGTYFTLKIIPSPANALVRFFINGEEVSATNNEITVSDGTVVDYRVSADNFDEKNGSIEIDGADVTETVTLETTLTITATPSSSTITLILNGTTYTATGSITKTVTYGNTYSYTVSDNGYLDEIGSGTITEQKDIIVNLQQEGINLSFAGIYKQNGGVETQKTFVINRTGTYKIELGGDNRPYYFTGTGKGGTALLQTDFNEGDILDVKIIYGGYGKFGNTTYFGGVGVGVWLNNSCILVAGGAGFISNVVGSICGAGGGGYNGGKSYVANGHGTGKSGYSADGSIGTNTTTSVGTGYKAYQSSNLYGYGGSGYVANKYSSIATLVYAGNETGNGYAKITFIE